MSTQFLPIALVTLAVAPIAALLAGAVQRRSSGAVRLFAECAAVIFLWLTFDASLLAMWGAHAAEYARLHAICRVAFVALQPIVPFLCYFHVVLPARTAKLPAPEAF